MHNCKWYDTRRQYSGPSWEMREFSVCIGCRHTHVFGHFSSTQIPIQKREGEMENERNSNVTNGHALSDAAKLVLIWRMHPSTVTFASSTNEKKNGIKFKHFFFLGFLRKKVRRPPATDSNSWLRTYLSLTYECVNSSESQSYSWRLWRCNWAHAFHLYLLIGDAEPTWHLPLAITTHTCSPHKKMEMSWFCFNLQFCAHHLITGLVDQSQHQIKLTKIRLIFS